MPSKAGKAERGCCVRCGRTMPVVDLNVEAVIHHGAKGVQCLDRQACERARRKAERR